jgi:RNA polymerase sigma-70 factor (ECF subfamily)
MPSESRDTNELLESVRRGEPGAVDKLLAAQREPLKRMIDLRLDPALAARLDASDVVQEVLLEVSRRLADYLREPTMPFHLWLRHIAKDHMIDAHRHHRLAQRRSLDRERAPIAGSDRSSLDILAQFRDPELTPASAAVRQELERRVSEAIAALDDEDREIILMRNCEQLSNQEVATVLGLSEPAASMRHLRAVRRLKALLGPEPQA